MDKTVVTVATVAVIGSVLYFSWWKPMQLRKKLELASAKNGDSNFSSADCGCGA